MSSPETSRRKSTNWSELDIENALQELAEGHGLHHTAVKYGIPPSTLSDRNDRVKSGMYGKRKCWTEEDLANAIDELQQGNSRVKTVSQKYKIPEVTLRAKLRKLASGVDVLCKEKCVVRRKEWREDDVANALLEVEQGERLTPVARKYGIPQSTLYERFQKFRSQRETFGMGLSGIESLPSGLNLDAEIMAAAVQHAVPFGKHRKKQVVRTGFAPPKTWTETDVFNALKELSEGIHPADAAEKYGIPLTTLKRRRDALIDGKLMKLRPTLVSPDENYVFSNDDNAYRQDNQSSTMIENEEDFSEPSSKVQKFENNSEFEIQEIEITTSVDSDSSIKSEPSASDSNDLQQSSFPNAVAHASSSHKTFSVNKMIEKLKQNKFVKPRRTWSDDDLTNALSDLMDGKNPTRTAEKYGIPLTTLKRRRDMLLATQSKNDTIFTQDKNDRNRCSHLRGEILNKDIRMALLSTLKWPLINAADILQREDEFEPDNGETSNFSTDTSPSGSSGEKHVSINRNKSPVFDETKTEGPSLARLESQSESQTDINAIANLFSTVVKQASDTSTLANPSVPNIISSNSADSLFFSLICLEMENLPRSKRQKFKQKVLKLLYEMIDTCD